MDAAIDVALTKDLDLGLTYGGQFAERYIAHAVKATLHVSDAKQLQPRVSGPLSARLGAGRGHPSGP